jgi:hypothetical protein
VTESRKGLGRVRHTLSGNLNLLGDSYRAALIGCLG